jgi:hypothetical protein
LAEFGWLLRLPIQQKPSKSKAQSPIALFIFFSDSQIAAQNDA